MKSPIILGPCCSGKTTVAKILSEATGLPRYSLDTERWFYYERLGMDMAKDEEMQKGDFENLLAFRRPYDIQVVTNAVDDFHDGIIEFGAAHAYWENQTMLERVLEAVKNVPHRILLMPSSNLGSSIETLNCRLRMRKDITGLEEVVEMNAKMIGCRSYAQLATDTVFTDGKPASQVAKEILTMLG